MGEKALKALESAILYAFVRDGKMKPGEVISSLPASVRSELQNLTSEDAEQQRVDMKGVRS